MASTLRGESNPQHRPHRKWYEPTELTRWYQLTQKHFYHTSNQIQTPFNCYFDIYIVREVLNFSAADLLGTKVYGSLRRKNQKHPCDHGGFRG